MLKNIPSKKKSAYSGDFKHHLYTDCAVKIKHSGLWINMCWSTLLTVSKTKTGLKKKKLVCKLFLRTTGKFRLEGPSGYL